MLSAFGVARPRFSLVDAALFVAGMASVCVGGFALLRWIGNGGEWLPRHAVDQPIPVILAVLFVLAGSALSALGADRARLGQGLGLGVALLALVARLWPVGTAGAFTAWCRWWGAPVPGLVVDSGALVAVAAFAPAGFALFLAKRRGRWEPAIIGTIGAALGGLAGSASAARLFGVPAAYLWEALAPSGVSLGATLGLTVVGGGLLCLAWITDRETFGARPSLWSISLAIGSITVTLAAWHVIGTREEAYQRRALVERASYLRERLRERVEAQLVPVLRRATAWEETGGGPARSRFEHEAAALVHEEAALRSVHWIDNTGETRWTATRDGASPIPRPPRLAPADRAAWQSARGLRRPTLTLAADGDFLYLVPVSSRDFDGAVAAYFPASSLFGVAIAGELNADDGLAVTRNGQELYRHGRPDGAKAEMLAVHGDRWEFALRPGRSFLGLRAHLSALVLFAGFLLSALLTTLVALARSVTIRLEERERISFDIAASEAKLRRQAGELTEARVAAVEALAAQANFLRGLRTEMETILRHVGETTDELLESRLATKPRAQVNAIRGWVEPLRLLLDDLVDFSPAEENQLQLRRTVFELPALLKSVRELYAGATRERGVPLTVHIEAAAPTVEGDPERLRRVLLHLVDAGLATVERGSISMRLSPVELTPAHFGARISVEAKSASGLPIGSIAPEALADSVAAHLVRLMDGTLGIEERPDGAIWWFTAYFRRARSKAPRRKRA